MERVEERTDDGGPVLVIFSFSPRSLQVGDSVCGC